MSDAQRALFQHIYEVCPILSEGSATLALLIRAATGAGVQERLTKHLAALHAASGEVFTTGTANKRQIAELIAAIQMDLELAEPLINEGSLVKARAAAPGMPGLNRGPHPIDPALRRYQLEIAPVIRYAVEVAAALQSQGKNDVADSILAKIASLLTGVRRIMQRATITPAFDEQMTNEAHNVQRSIAHILVELRMKNGKA